MLFCCCGYVTKLLLGRLAGVKTESQVYSKVSEVALGLFGVLLLCFGHEIGCFFAVANASITKPCKFCFAGSLAKKLKSLIFFSRVSEVTLGPFLVVFCYDLGAKLGAVLPLRMRHKAMQLLLGSFARKISEKSQFYQSFNQSFNFISIL